MQKEKVQGILNGRMKRRQGAELIIKLFIGIKETAL
jgi:hypothetical protein